MPPQTVSRPIAIYGSPEPDLRELVDEGVAHVRGHARLLGVRVGVRVTVRVRVRVWVRFRFRVRVTVTVTVRVGVRVTVRVRC